MDEVLDGAKEVESTGTPPVAVAKAVHRALTDRRPRTRYFVGTDAHTVNVLRRLLSDPLMDWLIRTSRRGRPGQPHARGTPQHPARLCHPPRHVDRRCTVHHARNVMPLEEVICLRRAALILLALLSVLLVSSATAQEGWTCPEGFE